MYIAMKRLKVSDLQSEEFDWSSYAIFLYNIPPEEGPSWAAKLQQLWIKLQQLLIGISDKLEKGFQEMIDDAGLEVESVNAPELSDSDESAEDESTQSKSQPFARQVLTLP